MARGAVVFGMGPVSLVVQVDDVDAAMARATSCLPVYGPGNDVLLVSRDPFAGEVTVCYVPTAAPRVTLTVPEPVFRVRGRKVS